MQKYSALDTETGGLDPEICGLCSIALVAPNGDSFYSLIKPVPGMAYEERALKISGITLKQMEEVGRPEYAVVKDFLSFFSEKCSDSFCAGCNIAFDVGFVKAAAKRCGAETYDLVCRKFLRKTCELQTVALVAHEAGIIELPNNKEGMPSVSLDSIMSTVGMERNANEKENHNALSDAKLTLATLGAVMKKIVSGISGDGNCSTELLLAKGNAPEIPAGSQGRAI